MAISYAPLRLRSNWSLLNGGSPIDAFFQRAARWGLSAMALTDDNLFGAVSFFEKARQYKIKPILGACLQKDIHLLVQNDEGYSSLCKLLSHRELMGSVGLDVLCGHEKGLILVTGNVELANQVREAFKHRTYLDHINLKSDLPPVAAGNAYFATPEDFEIHQLLCAIRLGKTLDSIPISETAGPNAGLLSPQKMERLFRFNPIALKNSLDIAEQCSFDLLARRTVFPSVKGADAGKLLQEHTLAGAQKRFKGMTKAHKDRINRELKVIISMGFADYFLVVEDIVRHARSLGTPTAGRGSGAGSAVAFALGITNVDPIKCELSFERFLNEGRSDYPDLDVDFCWRLRDDVIDYAYRRFGHDRVAMIATYATFQPRLALREAGKAMGLANPTITKISKMLKRGLSQDQVSAFPGDPEVLKKVFSLSQRILGYPRHISVHCGGVVITPGAIAEYAPLLKAEKGVVITAYDKDSVEKAGLVKLDLLGNRSLSTISEAVRLIKGRTGQTIDPEDLPDGGKAGFDLIRAGKTIGCGQLESPAMRHLLVQMAPQKELHIMQALALIRPGAAGLGMKETFIKRKKGEEPVPDMAPPLARILGEAYGVMLYEDDALRIAMALAGFPAGEADRLRKVVTKGVDNERARALVEKFVLKCRIGGVPDGEIEQMLRIMAKFKGYSFCRAHAASYARLACACAYLKARHPLEYWVAALNNNEGMYPKWVLIEEARRCGVQVLPPCANRSDLEFTLEGNRIRAGLGSIATLSATTIEHLMDQRPFVSFEELVARVAPKVNEAEALILCGAADFTNLPRNHLLWKLMTSYKKMRRLVFAPTQGGLGFAPPPPGPAQEIRVPTLPLPNEKDAWRHEWEILGFTAKEHPMTRFRQSIKKERAESSSRIPQKKGRMIRLAGVIGAARKHRTESGADMQFLTMEDEFGVFETILFQDVWKKSRFLLDGPGPYLVEGLVEDQLGALTVRASRLKRLS